MKYYIKTDENNRVIMLMKEPHPLISATAEVEMSESEMLVVSNDLNHYALDVDSNTLIYIAPTEEELALQAEEDAATHLNSLRKRREDECFAVVDRGHFWYAKLSTDQLVELNLWYDAWLNVTETLIIPEAPSWISDEN